MFLATWKDIPAANEVQNQIGDVPYSSGKAVVKSCHATPEELRDRREGSEPELEVTSVLVSDQPGLCYFQVLH